MSVTGTSAWRWPSASSASKSKELYLQRTVSVTDLYDDLAWCWRSSPPSPTESLISPASRSATPANPWRSNPTSPKAPIKSPSTVWSEAGAPADFSRCSTPVGPLKRPGLSSRSGSGSLTPTLKDVLPSSSQSIPCSPEADVKEALSGDVIITSGLIAKLRLLFPKLLSRQGWERQSSQRAYGWALQNPKLAILFLACHDLAAWRKAVIFGLEDSMLPFKSTDLDGVAVDPERVFDQQWRVLVKQIPMDGGITELENSDALPIQSLSLLRDFPGRSTDRVRWLGDQKQRIYMRKAMQCSSQAEKQNALDEIRGFRRLKHPCIIFLSCAYSQGLHVAAVTPAMEWDLESFLNNPSNTRRSERLLGWINDLTQALAHIHASELLHRDIRPTKVLVDANHRILLAFFGLPSPLSFTRSKSSQQYIYAAPELIHRNKFSRSADVFSLGCLFLDILTAVTQPTFDSPLAEFAAFRAATPSHALSVNTLPPSPLPNTTTSTNSTGSNPTSPTVTTIANESPTTTATVTIVTDASFHAHLDRVSAWMQQLRAAVSASRDAESLRQALSFVAAMLTPESARRPRTRTLAGHVRQWDELRRASGGRRRSEG
ncbi:MAG: hypothetical protein M1822_001581 [Bathelium mastoideum]|nr:MAG: hypothetical protein M1822_001581 [Bathelium mastoideum]